MRPFVREPSWGRGLADELHAAALEALRRQGGVSATDVGYSIDL